MANNKTNGQWYTDENGNHYFVKNGQSPKEGWEATHERKMDGPKNKQFKGSSSENFDDDYEEEFASFPDDDLEGYKESDRQWMKDHIEDNPDMSDKDLMDDILERFSELSPEDEQYVKGLLKNRKGFDLEDAINMADDDILDEQFGKDTPERKLAGAMKQSKNGEIPHKPVDMPKYYNEKEHIIVDEGPNKGESYDNEQDYRNSARSAENDLSAEQGLKKLNIPQGFGQKVSKRQFEEYVKLPKEDGDKLRKQGFLQNYHGYDIEEIDGRDEYRIWRLGK